MALELLSDVLNCSLFKDGVTNLESVRKLGWIFKFFEFWRFSFPFLEFRRENSVQRAERLGGSLKALGCEGNKRNTKGSSKTKKTVRERQFPFTSRLSRKISSFCLWLFDSLTLWLFDSLTLWCGLERPELSESYLWTPLSWEQRQKFPFQAVEETALFTVFQREIDFNWEKSVKEVI
jgi:hypothetical protein